jgi:hypothetical protein
MHNATVVHSVASAHSPMFKTKLANVRMYSNSGSHLCGDVPLDDRWLCSALGFRAVGLGV